ncbi:probable calcium-binding protein cml36 [Phtheirospermum japonicum]|uniref:Probable calcium-binding protein cml36 n=1 Tax=Phtheirospermum japonicum TaxID=374723 RepID=A0A830DML5_9LAMI|nr:probable calcium-binding protein cml36 [Phtheirospermum japonicum]
MIDRYGDGKIMTEDLERLLGRLGAAELPSREELTLMLSEVDRDGSGCISLEGFHAIGSAFAPPACDGEMREAFDFFDSDRDGRITAVELFRVFRTIGDAGCTLQDFSPNRANEGRDGEGDGIWGRVCLAFNMIRGLCKLHKTPWPSIIII